MKVANLLIASRIPFVAALQTGVVAATLLSLNFFPPASGNLMLIPLTDDAAHSVARLGLIGDNRLIGTGPIDGSLVVNGDRPDTLNLLRSHNIVVLAAPSSLCSAEGLT